MTLFSFKDNKALVFQFALSEFLQASKILRGKPQSDIVLKLIGSPYSSFQQKFGALNKIGHYLISLNLSSTDFLKTLDLAIKKVDALSSHKSLFREELIEIEKILKKTFGIILELISQIEADESLFYFLLSHHEEILNFYGVKNWQKLHKAFFPEGIHEAASKTAQKYEKRGFDYIIPLIGKKVDLIRLLPKSNVDQ